MGMTGRRLRRTLAIAALCTLAAGCLWAQPGFNAHRTGFNPHVHGIDSANAHTLEPVTSTPVYVGIDMVRSSSGLVHLLGEELRTIDPADGSLLWSMPWTWQNTVPTLLAIGDVVYVPSYDPWAAPHGCLTPYDAHTGALGDCLRFELPEPDEIQGGAGLGGVGLSAVASGPWIALTSTFTLASGDRAGWVSAVHTTDPARTWSAPVSDDPSVHVTNPVVVRSEIVVGVSAVGDESSALQRWPLQCTGAPCAPVSETVIEVQTANRIAADAAGERIAVLGPDELLVLSHPAGETLWSADLGTGNELYPLASPTWTPESLVATTSQGTSTGLFRFEADGCGGATCEPTWSTTVDGSPNGQVAAVTDVLVVSTSGEALRVFPEACSDPCAPLFDPPGYAGNAPAIVDMDRVFVVGDFDLLVPGQELVSFAPAG